jgi:hypothetical protein
VLALQIEPFITADPAPVTAGELAQKIADTIIELVNSGSVVIIPLATLVMLVSIGLLIVSGFTLSSSIRKLALGGIGVSALGLLIYFNLPTIMGFFTYLQQNFQP